MLLNEYSDFTEESSEVNNILREKLSEFPFDCVTLPHITSNYPQPPSPTEDTFLDKPLKEIEEEFTLDIINIPLNIRTKVIVLLRHTSKNIHIEILHKDSTISYVREDITSVLKEAFPMLKEEVLTEIKVQILYLLEEYIEVKDITLLRKLSEDCWDSYYSYIKSKITNKDLEPKYGFKVVTGYYKLTKDRE